MSRKNLLDAEWIIREQVAIIVKNNSDVKFYPE